MPEGTFYPRIARLVTEANARKELGKRKDTKPTPREQAVMDKAKTGKSWEKVKDN